MNTLHEVVYQIVSNPVILAEIAQNGQALIDRFNIAPTEVQAILALFQDGDTIFNLLANDYFPDPSPDQQWVP
jgi:hypothetical protein